MRLDLSLRILPPAGMICRSWLTLQEQGLKDAPGHRSLSGRQGVPCSPAHEGVPALQADLV